MSLKPILSSARDVHVSKKITVTFPVIDHFPKVANCIGDLRGMLFIKNVTLRLSLLGIKFGVIRFQIQSGSVLL